MGWFTPASFKMIFFATIASKPFGFFRILPPAAVTNTCKPQQLPKILFFLFNNFFASSICRIIGGVASYIFRRLPVHATPSKSSKLTPCGIKSEFIAGWTIVIFTLLFDNFWRILGKVNL